MGGNWGLDVIGRLWPRVGFWGGEIDVRSLSHLPPILDQGTSLIRTHEQSTTAAPYCSTTSLSAGEMTVLAFGLFFGSAR